LRDFEGHRPDAFRPAGRDSGSSASGAAPKVVLAEAQAVENESRAATSVDVEIFGEVYHVRGGQDRVYLQKLASLVDRKMREIGRHLPNVDAGKIAILAALNLADELLQCNQQQEGERAEIMEKVAELSGELDAAL